MVLPGGCGGVAVRGRVLHQGALVLATLLAACGGGAGTTTSPPPPPSSTPSTISVSVGDQQQAAAGQPVAVSPAVVVRDAQNAAVAGATVQFSVAAGGGTVEGASQITDASGVARVGKWTLGASGEQLLTAQVSGISPVSFHATVAAVTQVFDATIGASGGTFAIAETGHPYNGLRLTIPAGTFPANEVLQWRLVQNPTLPALPTGFRVAGAVLQISSSQLRGANLMTLEVPVSHAANEQVLIAFHDPVRGVTELMPAVYRTANLVVVATTHLRPDLLLGPGLAPSGTTLRSAGTDPVGWLMPVAYPLPMPTVPSVLKDIHRWPVLDFGSSTKPNGFGPAVPVVESVAAALDQTFASLDKALNTPGFHADPAQVAALLDVANQLTTITSDILEKYDAAQRSAISNFRLRANQSNSRSAFGKAEIDELANHAVLASLAINRKPLPAALIRAAQNALYGAAVAGSETSVDLLVPAVTSLATFTRLPAQGFQSIAVPPTGDQAPQAVDQVIPLSSFLVDFKLAIAAVQKVVQVSAMTRGSAEREAATIQMMTPVGIPAVTLETEAAPGMGFLPVDGNTVVVRTSTTSIRMPTLFGGGFVLNLAASGAEIARNPAAPLALSTVPVLVGQPNLTQTEIIASPFTQAGANIKQISAKLLKVVQAPFDVTPVTTNFSLPFETLSFSASIPMAPPFYLVEWEWGDGNVTVTHGSDVSFAGAATHQYVQVKDYKVFVTLRKEPGGAFLAADTVDVRVGQASHWKLTSFVDVDSMVSDLNDEVDTEGAIFVALKRAVAVPASAMISVMPQTANSSRLQLRVERDPAVTWGLANCCPPPGYHATEYDIDLGADPATSIVVGPFFAGFDRAFYSIPLNLNAGTIDGQYVSLTHSYNIKNVGTQIGPQGASRIHATLNGTTMTGTISFWVWLVNDLTGQVEGPAEEYRFNFTAVRLR